MARRDPLANPRELITRVYAYVAYRIGDGPEAEDVTSDVFERALRYRDSYDEARGEPLPWLLGIARRCVDDALRSSSGQRAEPGDAVSPENMEAETVERLTVAAAVERLDERSRELVALRYGADLTAKQIADVLGLRTNAVEVALHRTLARLRPELAPAREEGPPKGGPSALPPAEASASPGRK